MKSVVRLRMINWHLFANENVEIKNITFLTGANGTGKSTIIDAMQIVLLGDTSGRNFNKAANDRMGRTLAGYLRCETGETAQGQVMCLRPGRFTSYLALEIYDDKKKMSFTLGVVFDCYEDDTEEHHFFWIDSKIPDNGFSNSEALDKDQPRPLTYKELAKYFAESYKSSQYQFFDTNTSYQAFVKVVLGNLPDKFFTLFKKAVSFSPITDISSFITEYVCDIDHNIDITSMQTNIEQYKLLELEAKKIKGKIDELSAVKVAYEEFAKVKDSLALAEYVANRANYEADKSGLEDYKKKLSDNKDRIVQINILCKQKDDQIAELKNDKESYLAKKVGSAGYSLTASLSQKKNQVLEKIASLEQNYNAIIVTLKDYISDYQTSLAGMSKRLQSGDFSFLNEPEADQLEKFKDIASDFVASIDQIKKDIDVKNVTSEEINEFQTEMASCHSYAIKMSHMIEDSIFSLTNDRDSLESELSEINAGHKPYNGTYLEVKAALEAALKERYSQATVSSYCDLVDIRDKRWTKAIEAFIFNQKFNFFVDARYYEDASKILTKIASDYRYYNVSIVDTERLLQHGFNAAAGSVAEEISTDHEGAKVYTNFLLGHVAKCETFSEARDSGNGLLPNCTGYRSYASFYLNQQKGEVSFIGTKLDETTILTKKNDYAAISKKIDCYNDLGSYFINLIHLEVLNSSQCQTFNADLASMSKVNDLNKEAAHYDDQMKEGELGNVASFDAKLKAIDEDISSIQAEKDKLLLEEGGLESQNTSLENDLIPTKSASLTFIGDKLLGFDPVAVKEKYDPFFENAIQNLPLARIKADAQTHYVQIQNGLKTTKSKLIDLRSKYTAEYNLGYDSTKEQNNDEFDKELDNLSGVLLPSYLIKIEDAHKKAIKEFKDDFIYKLRTSFETITSQITELNQALEAVKFGRDSYRFSVEPNKDYLDYYNMITDDLLLNVGDAEDVYLEKYEPVMTNLFNMISDSADQTGDVRQQIIDNVAKFTDYRTYLVFDLLVKRGEDQEASSLARTFKRQSGGETQTPFYISILASFAQLYRTNEADSDSLRLVIFDEAFSKMDGSRIKESVGLLRSFGLQAILSTPSEKLRDLSREVDLVLVAIHDSKKNRSYLDIYKEASDKQIPVVSSKA